MKDSILIFGGGILQLSIINRVKLAGFQSIVIDPDPKAIGKVSADIFYEVSGSDYETTKKIAQQYNVIGIVTAATDNPILMMCRLAEDLNLPFPSYDSCETVLDKAKFKEFLKRNNFPHAKGEMVIGETDVDNLPYKFPLITKPVINSGSRGVIKSNTKEELKKAIKETLIHSKDGRILIEEYVDGDEISVEALVQDKKVYILQLTDKIVTPPPYNVELDHIQPSKYDDLKSKILGLLQTIVDKTGLDNCALHPELKIDNGTITIIEIGPRLGGDYITSELVPLSTGVNIEDQLLKIAIGIPVLFKCVSKASMISYFNFTANEIVKNKIHEKHFGIYSVNLKSLAFNLDEGDIIPQITNSLNRYGHFILKGNSLQELHSIKKEIENILKSFILY